MAGRHFPARSGRELRAITALICDAVPVDLLLLFGSHARGDWVEDHEHVNDEIRVGSYFFGDIRQEGIVLFSNKNITLASPKAATPTERLQRAEHNLEYWLGSAEGFFRGWAFYASQGLNNQAAFILHQTVERLYTAVAMVFTGYKRKEHDLGKLHAEVAPLHPDLVHALPRSTPEDAHLFDLLRRAYIDARYVKSYRITPEELAALGERTGAFMAVVRRVCEEKIASLRAAAGSPPQG